MYTFGETPFSMFEKAVGRGSFIVAAAIARDFGFKKSLVRENAFKAFCKLENAGAPEAAREAAAAFGLTVAELAPNQALRLVPPPENI
jgi:hypothetical protein